MLRARAGAAEPVADVFDPVGSGRRAGLEVEVAAGTEQLCCPGGRFHDRAEVGVVSRAGSC
jgi:hypothetical protein